MTPSIVPRRTWAWLAVVAAMVVVPFVLPGYLVGLVVLGFVYAVFALSVDLVWGYAGVLTFGHAVFFGTGAYAVATLLPGSVAVALGGAVLLCSVLGVLVAAPLFTRGVGAEYFAIVTLSLSVIAAQAATTFSGVTGGSNGLRVPTPVVSTPVAEVELAGLAVFYLALASLVVAYVLARRTVRSAFGRALVGTARNERKARALGYDVARYRTVAFGLSSGLAGFAGALFAVQSGFVSPSVLGFELSTAVLIWVLVGGRRTLVGPVLGAVGITVFENVLSGVLVSLWTLVLGLVLVLVVTTAPGGLAGLLSVWFERVGGTAVGSPGRENP